MNNDTLLANRVQIDPGMVGLGQPFAACGYAVAGDPRQLRDEGEMLYSEGLHIIEGLRDALIQDEGEGNFSSNPLIAVGMLFGAERLLKLGMELHRAAARRELS